MEKLIHLIFGLLGLGYAFSEICKKIEWKCETEGCIRFEEVCDGIMDCMDNSDEEPEFCLRWEQPNITQTENEDCLLDDVLPNIKVFYESNPKLPLRPEDVIDNYSTIKYICDKNYKLRDDNHINTCVKGKFLSPRPKCSRTCSSDALKIISVQSLCFRDKQRIPCGETIFAGTDVKLSCEVGYEKPKWITSPDEIKCQENGEWSSLPYYCQQICGLQTEYSTPLISGGEKVNATDVPWNAGVYKLTDGKFEHICGGTIVNAKIILSAAHCFWNVQSSKPSNKKGYSITVGKTYRDYYVEEPRSQKFKLKDLFIARGYEDASLHYQDDFAILVIEGTISFEQNIRPICVKESFDSLFEKYLPAKTIGTVAGWGVTENGKASDELRRTEIQILDKHVCKRQLSSGLAHHIGKKYCVGGLIDGNSACTGDSGAAVFSATDTTENGVQKYYLWGIVSTALSKSLSCNDTLFMSLTNVALYTDELREYTVKYHVSTCSINQWQCDNGKCIPKESLCNRVVDCPDQSDEKFCTYASQGPATVLSTENMQQSKGNGFQGTPPKGSCILSNLTENLVVNYGKLELSQGNFAENHGRISYACSRHFKLVGSTKNSCYNGKFDDPHPECLLTCTPEILEGVSFQAKCSRNGKKVSCDEEILAGTVATFACKPRYSKPKNVHLDVSVCQPEGRWDYTDFKCVQECGIYKESENTVFDFGNFKSTFYPWEVLIITRKNETGEWYYHCSGVLISARVVVGVSYCFTHHKDSLHVAIFDDPLLYRKIERVHSSTDDEINYSVVIMETPTVLKLGIRPICLSKDKSTMVNSLIATDDENPHKLRVSWDGCRQTKKKFSVTDPNQSNVLYTDEECREITMEDEDEDVELDGISKFCVRWGNHKTKCDSGYKGGGIALELIEDSHRIHYLVGLIDFRKIVLENGTSYAWAINMTSYIHELQNYIDQYEVK